MSGAFTPPDYFIDGESSDVYRGLEIKLDYTPAIDFVVPTSYINRVNCNFTGENGERSFTFEETKATTYNIRGFNNDSYEAGIYHIAGMSPEGQITADPGSLATANIGLTGTLYLKSGTGNTGWELK